MQFPGKSGKMYPNQMQASQDQSQSPSDDGGGGQPAITDNPEAMQCIDKLQQMGYTADDVAQAMDSDSGQSQQQAPAASASIPSMG